MSRTSRVVLLVAAVAVLLVAYIALRPGNDSSSNANTTPPVTITTQAPDAGSDVPTRTTAPTRKRPSVPVIRVKALKPVGGVRSLKFTSGQRARFSVTSDRAEEVHVHGYDISEDVVPGKPVRFDFRANLEGIFEVELEHSAVPIIKLTVNPK